MFRLLAALLLVRLLAEAGGVDLLVQSCDTPCEESKSGDCSPDCDSCVCCPHRRIMTLSNDVEPPAPGRQHADFVAAVSPVQDPRAQEIFHIPKA